MKSQQLFSYLFILLIAVVFTLQFGPGSRGCDNTRAAAADVAAADVNGREISARTFNRAFDNQLAYLRSQGTPLPESMARQFGYPKQILEYLVSRELIAQTADQRGLTAADEEIRKAVRQNPNFQRDGRFDRKLYEEILRDYEGKTIPEFEKELRRDLGARKLEALLRSAALVSEDEVRARFQREGNQADLTFVRFLPSMFADKATKPSDAEVEIFRKEKTKEIADYYNANQFLYFQPEKVRARHILIKVPKDAPADKKAEAKAKVEALRKRIVDTGADFAELAKESSEDTGSKPSGGDLGFNEKSAWVPEFANVAFALKPGELSEPVETQFGVHLIKVEEKKPPESKQLPEVEAEIAKQLLTKEASRKLAQAEAEKALAAAKSGKKLAELFPAAPKGEDEKELKFETETKPQATQTGLFSASAPGVPKLGNAPQLMNNAFAQTGPGLLPGIFQAGDGFAVAEITDRQLPSDAEYASKKEELRREAQQAKQMELRETFVSALRKSSQVKLNDEVLYGTGS